jgi:hypothetical protein
LGINPNTIVYVSGANYFKIIPEQEVTWAKIIASVPNSILVLYPFNANWSSDYPAITFRERIMNTFAEYGLSADRLLILEPVPNRADVKQRLQLSDIYLDSYPYSGMTSLIDPLQVGLPTVVMEGETSRSRKGASLLRSLGIFDLITDNEADYIQLAVNLGNDPELRQRQREAVKRRMENNPSFLDSRFFSGKMGDLFQEYVTNYLRENLKESLHLRDTNLIIFPDPEQSEQCIYEELVRVISSLENHPDCGKMTLLVNASKFPPHLTQAFTEQLCEEEEEGLQISVVGKLSPLEWAALLPRLTGRIVLAQEDGESMGQLPMEQVKQVPSCDLGTYSRGQGAGGRGKP